MSGDRSRSASDSRSRSHSRSGSRSRSRSGSYNSDSYSDYSDEFYSDAESFRGGKNNKTNSTNKPNYAKRKPVKPTAKKAGRTSKMSSIRDSHDSQVAHRMLSARRLKVNELRNRVEELNQQLYEVERENKLLKRQNVMKDRVIDKHEGEDSEVPRLIQRHANEIRTLKEQMRKYKEKSMKLSDNVKDKDSQLVQTKKTLQKYKKIVESKNLGERDHLANRLTSAESALDESRRRVQELERHIENLQKNHRHELGIERARHKETKAQLKDLADRHDQIAMHLREKEKELDVRNIYSMRVMKPPHKLNSALTSTSSTPAPSSRKSTGGHQRKNSDPLSPQHRRNQKAAMQEVNQKLEVVARQRERDDTLYEEPKVSSRKGPSSRDRERARMREEEDMRRAEEEERDRMREEAERMKRVAEEKAKIERERKEEAERREIVEAKRRMEEDERKKEEEERQRSEIERKAREERDRLARDAEEQERQRKKQALLAKLSAMDEPEQNGKNKNILTMSPTRTRKDWKFSDPVENMYQGKPAYDITSSPKRKNKLLQEEDEFSYKPSFGGKWNNGPKTTTKGKSLFDDDPPKNTNKDKKTDLMASLFGGDTARKPTPPSTEREGSGLDFSNAASRRKSSTKPANQTRENSVQMFGGGIGVVDDSPPNSSNRLLPKRTNQSSAAFNRPAVNEIDDLDEIEEVVL